MFVCPPLSWRSELAFMSAFVLSPRVEAPVATPWLQREIYYFFFRF